MSDNIYHLMFNFLCISLIPCPVSVVMHKEKDENGMLSHIHSHEAYRSRELGILEHSLLDGDMFLQVCNAISSYSTLNYVIKW